MICGIGLCLRVGKKNLYVANDIVRTNLFLFFGWKIIKRQGPTTYVFSKEKKISKISHQNSPFFYFWREHVATSLFTNYIFNGCVQKYELGMHKL
jgi:hypothetical protein